MWPAHACVRARACSRPGCQRDTRLLRRGTGRTHLRVLKKILALILKCRKALLQLLVLVVPGPARHCPSPRTSGPKRLGRTRTGATGYWRSPRLSFAARPSLAQAPDHVKPGLGREYPTLILLAPLRRLRLSQDLTVKRWKRKKGEEKQNQTSFPRTLALDALFRSEGLHQVPPQTGTPAVRECQPWTGRWVGGSVVLLLATDRGSAPQVAVRVLLHHRQRCCQPRHRCVAWSPVTRPAAGLKGVITPIHVPSARVGGSEAGRRAFPAALVSHPSPPSATYLAVSNNQSTNGTSTY